MTWDLDITDSVSLVIHVMIQVVGRSSIWHITLGWIILRGHTSTMEDVISWSRGVSTEWKRIRKDPRFKSGNRHDMLTHRHHRCLVIRSRELRDSGFWTVSNTILRTRGVGLQSLEGMGPKRFVLFVLSPDTSWPINWGDWVPVERSSSSTEPVADVAWPLKTQWRGSS
jgi:hypothetical protein